MAIYVCKVHYYKKQTVYVLPQNTTAELKAEHISYKK